jgi:hypothetical protein
MSWTPTSLNSLQLFAYSSVRNVFNAFNDTSGMILANTTQKLGIQYFPSTTSPITHVDFRQNVAGGTPASETYKIGVFADSGRAPDDATQLGTYTSGFVGVNTDGWVGMKALGTNTGNLTLNKPVWIVIEYVSGSDPTTNKIQLQYVGAYPNREYMRHHNGTNWTTTTAVNGSAYYCVTHADGTFSGMPITGIVTVSGLNDIYVNTGTVQTQGIRFMCGSQVKVIGVGYLLTKTGSPNDLTWTVYEGDTSKYSQTETAANVITTTYSTCYFSSPVLLAADTYIYILATQTGTSTSNDYTLHAATADASYIDAVLPPNIRMVSGNGTTPSELTVSTTKVPICFPIIADTTTDLDQAASGGVNMPRTRIGH